MSVYQCESLGMSYEFLLFVSSVMTSAKTNSRYATHEAAGKLLRPKPGLHISHIESSLQSVCNTAVWRESTWWPPKYWNRVKKDFLPWLEFFLDVLLQRWDPSSSFFLPFFFCSVIFKRSRDDHLASDASIGRLCRTPPCAQMRGARLQGREPLVKIIKSSRQFNIFGCSFARCKKAAAASVRSGKLLRRAASGGHCFGNAGRNLSADRELFQTINRACCWH